MIIQFHQVHFLTGASLVWNPMSTDFSTAAKSASSIELSPPELSLSTDVRIFTYSHYIPCIQAELLALME